MAASVTHTKIEPRIEMLLILVLAPTERRDNTDAVVFNVHPSLTDNNESGPCKTTLIVL